jgi:transcriptional regulator with XRE-family HTH domain
MGKRIKVKELFPINLSRLRKEAGLPQLALAKKAGLTHNFINDLENGKKGFSLTTLDKLSEALNVEPMEFFINPDNWDKADKIRHLMVLENIHKRINNVFEDYKELKLKN